jgi:hypothetical protein
MLAVNRCRCKAELDDSTYLCPLCQEQLSNTLADFPALLRELDVTVTRQDHLDLGIVGRGSFNPSPVNWGASKLADEANRTLHTWARVISGSDTATAAAPLLAIWMSQHTALIAARDDSHDCYQDVVTLSKKITDGIDRIERMFIGSCLTVTGHDRQGREIECGCDLYCPRDATHLICHACGAEIEVRRQLLATIARRDLSPEGKLIEVLANLNENITQLQLRTWVMSGALRVRGYIHAGRVVDKQVRRGDARLFSISAARELRRRELIT